MGSLHAQLVDELGYDPDAIVDEPGIAGRGSAAEWQRVSVDDVRVPAGEIRAARIGARRVAVARLASGKLVVVDDECPHDGGRISDGFVDGERLVCARHGWELVARNGRCERACKLRE